MSLPGFDKHPVTFYFVRFDVALINCCIKKRKNTEVIHYIYRGILLLSISKACVLPAHLSGS